ncbi:MAG: hypothetical protein CL920_14130 [Deltaproteobacteria bacterium]|nr:hypothetical protein [Deltaproteobacteria bacterium]MBU49827.1 hypothetical protein [Deltaproteobacteria bacterium]
MRTCLFFLCVSFLLMGVESGGCGRIELPPAPKCHYNGEPFEQRSFFLATDGCNYCSCGTFEGEGHVTCTRKVCTGPGQQPCLYNDKFHLHGDTYIAADGCNACRCENGKTLCTEKLCPCGGPGGLKCLEGFVCIAAEGSCALSTSGGTCQKRPSYCDVPHEPVCGCDGRTYFHACFATFDGVSLKSRQPCQP